DHRTAVGVADEDDGAVELVDNRRRVGSVVRDPAQRVRWRENGVAVADEPAEHRLPAGRLSGRAGNENNGRTRHDGFLSFRWAIGCPLLGPSGLSPDWHGCSPALDAGWQRCSSSQWCRTIASSSRLATDADDSADHPNQLGDRPLAGAERGDSFEMAE